jgi:peptidoglycan/LPS O-acetylase OafA/YrhL
MTTLPTPVRYLLGGLLIGGFWYLNRHRPPWEEALRTIAVFAVLMTALKAKLRNSAVEVHLVPLIASKAVLVLIAAIVEQALTHGMSKPADAPLYVAAGLALAVTVLGPIGDGHYFSRVRPPQRQTPAAQYGPLR